MIDLIINNDADPHSKYRKFLDLIPTGEVNAVSMDYLSKILDVSVQAIRQSVQDARIDGNIIARSNCGYFIPYYNYSMSRIKSNSKSLKAVRKKLKEENALEYDETIFS